VGHVVHVEHHVTPTVFPERFQWNVPVSGGLQLSSCRWVSSSCPPKGRLAVVPEPPGAACHRPLIPPATQLPAVSLRPCSLSGGRSAATSMTRVTGRHLGHRRLQEIKDTLVLRFLMEASSQHRRHRCTVQPEEHQSSDVGVHMTEC